MTNDERRDAALPAIARQPIFDLDGQLYGYELLYRGIGGESCGGDEMTARVMVGALTGLDLDLLACNRPVLINATRTLLMSDLLQLLPPRRVILEILEDVPPDPALLHRLGQLTASGYRLALDDCLEIESRRPFLPFVEIIKVDVPTVGTEALAAQADDWQRTNKLLLAEKVETPEEHAALYEMGFHLFQGYFFARPQRAAAAGIPANKLVVMQLLTRVNDPDITLTELADIVQTDAALSLGVLRWTNSPLAGLRTRVDSIERAVVVLGIETIRSLVSLLALARLGTTPSELLTLLLVRARLCELLARATGSTSPATHFMVGLLSGLDAVMNRPMEELLDKLPLGPQVELALRSRQGPFGETLAAVERAERGEFGHAEVLDVPAEVASQLYRDAVRWASDIHLLVPSAGTRRPQLSAA
jgi:EAL and modified HD-GYP domain-containing signal transduction protein